jgi:hypothetical protein
MIVDSNGNDLFCHILPDDILIEEMFYLGRFKEVDSLKIDILFCAELFVHNTVSLLNTVVTNMSFKTSNKYADLFFGPAAK